LHAPIVVEACAVLDWVFVAVHENCVLVAVAGGRDRQSGSDGEEVVHGVGATLHFSDSSKVVIIVNREGVGSIGAEAEIEAGSSFPVIDEKNLHPHGDGVVVVGVEGGRRVVEVGTGGHPTQIAEEGVVRAAVVVVIVVVADPAAGAQ